MSGERPGRGTLLLALPVALLLVWLVLYPNLFVLRDSVMEGGRLTLEHWRRFWESGTEREALWASVWISAASVALSAAVGVPLAFLFARWEFPGRRLLGGLAALPVLLPPLVGTISFLFLYGESGFLTRGVQLLLGLAEPPWRLTGAWAILLVHAYTMYVYFYLFTAAGLARLDASYAEAAAALGAGRWTTLRRVTLPLLAPALGGAGLLVFMTSMASFSAPYVFGGGFRVLTTQLYASKLNGEEGLVAVEATVLALASLVFLLMLQRYERGREYTGASKGSGAAARKGGGRGALLLSAVAFLGVGLLLLPHATVLLVSFVPEGSWTVEILPPVYSAETWRTLFTDADRLVPVLNSLRMATVATLANVAFAFAAGYLLARRRFPGRRMVDALVVLPWALPGTVLAVALASTFSVSEPLAGRFVLVGTFAILPLAYFIRNVPLVTRAALASFRQLDPALEEAAASLGAGRVRTLARVVLPLVLPGLAAGALLAWVTALGEFVASVLLYTHRTRPISVEMLAQLRAFDFGGAAAYGVLLIALVALAFVFGWRRVNEEPGGG
ncbi:MAG TPA: iron ABC transporter permease [Longimicrobiaceae bacterium]|nr:iron ABC transporter permease [Longimicrobiaceae bacterium]